MRITFYGAAQTVTGSKYLLETDKSSMLVDCGLFQGKKLLRLQNWQKTPFNPRHLSAIALTHAHIDHSGYLPRLVKDGFRGPIFCTAATRALLHLLLPDAAHLQEEEAEFANRHGTSKHHPAEPLYTVADAEETLKMLQTFPRHVPIHLTPDITMTAYCAGHILGASILNIDHNNKRITFSGDIGRYNSPLLPDPEPVPIGDLLICESTYGDRTHADSDVKKELAVVINEAVKRGGPLIIPAFAVGRTQDLLYWIRELENDGAIPIVPVIIDSPMAVDATEIYRDFKNDFDKESQELLAHGQSPLRTRMTAFCRSVEDSKKLNTLKTPRIIISASGMATGGRVLHHLTHWLPREEATIFFVGYQAVGTRGRLIQSGAREVKIFSDYVPVHAHVRSISGLSAHGDRNELLRWLKSCDGVPKQTKIVHGEPEASRAFAELLNTELSFNASQAQMFETVEV